MSSASADTPSLHVLGALALELKAQAPVGHTAVDFHVAGTLAGYIARDLAAFAPGAAGLELVTVGAHYDPVELLRPGWPLHRELDQLSVQAPRTPDNDGGHIIAFGTHEGRLPGALSPSPDYVGGPMRLVPFVLGGDTAIIREVGDLFERDLLERGMAAADTALAAQDAFGLQVEHARFLTLHDLAAMTALQYEHAGLAPLWPLIETALLAPEAEAWLDDLPEPLAHYADGEARIAMFTPQAWHTRYAGSVACDAPETRQRLQREYAHFEARQRQFAAVLQAHGVPVHFVHCEDAEHSTLG